MARTKQTPRPRPAYIAPSTDKVDRLSRLPPELIDRIFHHAYATLYAYWRPPSSGRPQTPRLVRANRPTPPLGAISKALLPFHRRQYTRLALPRPVNDLYHRQLLTEAENLETLDCAISPDLPSLLRQVAQPGRLQYLELFYDGEIVDDTLIDSICSALSGFVPPKLKKLTLGFEFDTSNSSIREACRKLSLEHLAFSWDCHGVGSAYVLGCIDGPDSIPSLKHLSVGIIRGERGDSAIETGCSADSVEASWELPEWWDTFTAADMRNIMAVGERKGIKVDGDTVDALQIMMEYDEEMDEAENRERSYGGGYGYGEEDEEYEDFDNYW
ncbi:hypothetical protein JCM8097_006567 [Rhodosporidiobolus ruineniae]